MQTKSPPIAVAAVDVGNSTTKYTFGRVLTGHTSQVSCGLFPSVAPRVQWDALPQGLGSATIDGAVVEVGGLHYFVGNDSLHMAGPTDKALVHTYSTLDEYHALFLGALHYIAFESKAADSLTIQKLVVGLPVNMFATKRHDLRNTVIGEHIIRHPADPKSTLKIQVEDAIVIVQPLGALVHHSVTTPGTKIADFSSAVLDLGGGTFDWYVSQHGKANANRSGAASIGLNECSKRISEAIRPGWSKNPNIMSRVDKALRENAPTVMLGGDTFQMADYLPLANQVLQSAVDKMLTGIQRLDDLDILLCTGGGGLRLSSMLSAAMPELSRKLGVDKDPIFANVRGFHMCGELALRRAQAQ